MHKVCKVCGSVAHTEAEARELFGCYGWAFTNICQRCLAKILSDKGGLTPPGGIRASSQTANQDYERG